MGERSEGPLAQPGGQGERRASRRREPGRRGRVETVRVRGQGSGWQVVMRQEAKPGSGPAGWAERPSGQPQSPRGMAGASAQP